MNDAHDDTIAAGWPGDPRNKEPVRYVSAEAMTHDDFGVPFTMTPGEIVFDAKTNNGPWATMTASSFVKHGFGLLGLGFGQKYVRQPNGQLHKVEG